MAVTVTSIGGVSALQGAPTTYTFYKAPTITGMLPTSASVGSLLTVSGSCLHNLLSLSFIPTGGGSPSVARFTNISTGQITVAVPLTLSTGEYTIQVITPGGESPVAPLVVFTVPI